MGLLFCSTFVLSPPHPNPLPRCGGEGVRELRLACIVGKGWCERGEGAQNLLVFGEVSHDRIGNQLMTQRGWMIAIIRYKQIVYLCAVRAQPRQWVDYEETAVIRQFLDPGLVLGVRIVVHDLLATR